MKKKESYTEIDLIKILSTIMKNKLKIILITLFFILLAFVYHLNKQHTFLSTTEIKPINIFDENLYNTYNTTTQLLVKNKLLNENEKTIFNLIVDKEYLLNLFLDEFRAGTQVRKALIKYDIIDRQKYINEEEYLNAVKKKELSIILNKPFKTGKKIRKNKIDNTYWTIRFNTSNKKNWEAALKYIDIEINKKIKKYLSSTFQSQLDFAYQIKNFQIENINYKIDNARILYHTQIKNKLAFLKEQASIARELGIETNTLESQILDAKSSLISNIQTKNPYYMRGYVMIEKEIELIKSRNSDDKDSFTTNLITLIDERRNLTNEKSSKIIKSVFLTTPIFNTENKFTSANINYGNTEFVSSYSLIKILFLSTIIGLLIGIFYVLVNNAILQRKK